MSDGYYTLGRIAETEQLAERAVSGLREDLAAAGLPDCVKGVLLGGGYGRGEGGCATDRQGDTVLYNDFDLFVFTENATVQERKWLTERFAGIGRKWEHELHIDVDFAPAREIATLSRVGSTLMYQELKFGHRILYGEDAYLQTVPTLPPERLPLIEGARLLLNRGTGLLLALEKLHSSEAKGEPWEQKRDFIWRNLHKCALGCGDALFLARGKYDYRVARREEAAEELPETLRACYRAAVEFKRRAVFGTEAEAKQNAEEMRLRWGETFLRFAEQAGKATPKTLEEASEQVLNEPRLSGGTAWKNVLLNLRYRTTKHWSRLSRAPQLFLLGRLARQLANGEAPDREYLRLWKRFN